MGSCNNIMPIIGLETTIFGYVVEGNSYYNGPYYKFVFCDESGNPVSYKLDRYLILSVQPHYYSASVSSETNKVIIIRPNYSLYSLRGYHYKESTYVLELSPIGNNGLFFTSKSIIDEDKFGHKSHLFHPISYLDYYGSPFLINIPKKEIVEKYYLFSILSFHFVVDWNDENTENPDDFTYSLLDSDGNTIYTWNKGKQLKSVWHREDGTFTIFSVSKCYQDCYDYENSKLYDKSNYSILYIICLNESYDNLTIDEYKKEIDDNNKSNQISLMLDFFGDSLYTDDSITIEEYEDWRKRKSITDRTVVLKSEYLKCLNCNPNYSNYGRSFNPNYSGLFCDNNYFIVKHECGFTSFNKSSLLSINDFSNVVNIDKWDRDDCEYTPMISNCKYGNGMVGFQLMKKYIGFDPEGESDNDQYVGKYRLHDIYGNCIGELHGNLLISPKNGIGIPQFFGYIDNDDFSIIIPPIYKEILSLDRYFLKKKITAHDNSTITHTESVAGNAPNKDEFMYTCNLWGDTYGVLEDKTLHIVSLEIGSEGRTLHGIFENGKELVPMGNNVIKKISGQYLLVRDIEQSLYTLYYYSGKILYENVKDVEVVNLYNVIIHGEFWEIQHSEISKLFSYSKVFFEYGFRILRGDKCIIDDIILDVKAILYTTKDVFMKARLLNGNIILFSIKNGLILFDYESEYVADIKVAFPKFQSNYSYISHIVKYGEELTEESKQKINDDLWNKSNNPDLYLRFSSNNAVLVKIKDKYMIVPGNANNNIDYSLFVDDELSQSFKGLSDFSSENAIDSSIVVNDVSFIGRDDEVSAENIVLRIQMTDGRIGYFSTAKGWIIQPEYLESCDLYDKYLIFNNHIISHYGGEYSFNKLEFISRTGQCSAYYDSIQNSYVIIDGNCLVYKNLIEIGQDNLVNIELDEYSEYQLVLNKSTKELTKVANPYYKKHSYCPVSSEYTDEDAWDAMTDGQYGDYPGSGWDSEAFGY